MNVSKFNAAQQRVPIGAKNPDNHAFGIAANLLRRLTGEEMPEILAREALARKIKENGFGA